MTTGDTENGFGEAKIGEIMTSYTSRGGYTGWRVNQLPIFSSDSVYYKKLCCKSYDTNINVKKNIKQTDATLTS